MAKAKAKKAANIPAGFKAVAVGGGFGAWHDFSTQKILTGKIVGMDSMMVGEGKKKKKRRILRVEKSDGVVVSCGESYGIKELFDTKGIVGKRVFIRLDKTEKFKKDGETRKVHNFTVALG
jgi:hypothetical protein